ncbi:TfoX/Sxy family DNA transformation protein [Paenibacillus xanthanilyticus]|uniref:TfoX/Sxy family DNA transformation protein n=1 Tax=Paenibacillus xanthanilyticus TaxID=1783531 RepID=A0ABV8K1G6_9BACL
MTMRKTMRLKNIGAKTEHLLRQIGVRGVEDLSRVGSLGAYRRLKAMYPDQINLVALYALEGALLDIHWLELSPAWRAELKRQAEEA